MPSDLDSTQPVPLDYGRPPAIRERQQKILIVAIALVGAYLGVSIALPYLNPPRDGDSTRVKCASNLRQIGQALQMYAINEHGRLPDDLLTLLSTQDLSPAVFVCWDTSDVPASGKTAEEIGADFAKPGHCSYVYLGKGLTESQLDADTVLAYEPLANHGNSGMNVLFGDGHVEWIQRPLAQGLSAQALSSRRPVKLPAKR